MLIRIGVMVASFETTYRSTQPTFDLELSLHLLNEPNFFSRTLRCVITLMQFHAASTLRRVNTCCSLIKIFGHIIQILNKKKGLINTSGRFHVVFLTKDSMLGMS